MLQRALSRHSRFSARLPRSIRASFPTRQEPNTSANAPPFGSCRVGNEARMTLPDSTIEGSAETFYPG